MKHKVERKKIKAGLGLIGWLLLGLWLCPLSVGCGPTCQVPTGKWQVTMTSKSGNCPTPAAQIVDFGDDGKEETSSDNCKYTTNKAACSMTVSCQESGDQELTVTGQLTFQSSTKGTGSANMKIVNSDGSELNCEFSLAMAKQ